MNKQALAPDVWFSSSCLVINPFPVWCLMPCDFGVKIRGRHSGACTEYLGEFGSDRGVYMQELFESQAHELDVNLTVQSVSSAVL